MNKNITIDVTYYCGDFCVSLRYPLERKKTVEQLPGAWLFSQTCVGSRAHCTDDSVFFFSWFCFSNSVHKHGCFSFEGNKKKTIFFLRSGHLFRLAQARLISKLFGLYLRICGEHFLLWVCLPRARSALCCSVCAVHTHCVREVRKATALLHATQPGLGTRHSPRATIVRANGL